MLELLFFALAGLAIFFGGLIKGATGMGAPMIAVPVMASIYGVPTAIAVMTVPLVVSNVWQMWTYRHASEGRASLWRLLIGCLVGVVVGTFLLGILNEAWLAIVLAMMLFIYLALRLFQPELKLGAAKARRVALPVGLLTGVLQGAAGMSTPVSVTFVHSQRLPREAYAFAVSAMFTTLAASQLFSLSAVGIMTWHYALLSAAALVPIMVGVWSGQKLGEYVSQRTFERLTFGVLVFVGLALLARAIPQLVP